MAEGSPGIRQRAVSVAAKALSSWIGVDGRAGYTSFIYESRNPSAAPHPYLTGLRTPSAGRGTAQICESPAKGFLRSIVPWNDFRGVRSRGESCAKAVIAIVIASAEAMLREIRRTFRFLQFKRDSPLCQKWASTSSATVCLDARPLYGSLGTLESYAVLTPPDRKTSLETAIGVAGIFRGYRGI